MTERPAPPHGLSASPGSADDLGGSARHDDHARRYATMAFAEIVDDLRQWREDTETSRCIAAMVRLIDMSLFARARSPDDRLRSALLAVVVEQIVRGKLRDRAETQGAVDIAHQLLLLYAETYSHHPDLVAWMREERQRRGLPGLD